MKTLKSFKELSTLTPSPTKKPAPKASISDQIKAIQSILTPSEYDAFANEDYVFTFGQYRGQLLSVVVLANPNYVKWVLSEDFIGPKVRSKIERLTGFKGPRE